MAKIKIGNISGGGTAVTVDTALSTTSTNPVQNKVVTAELNKKLESDDLDDYAKTADVVEKTSYETWTFVDEDNNTITKKVAIIP